MKYQNDSGPSAEEVIGVIREYSSAPREDEQRFLDALIFNWLIAGTDGHGKNYSLLLGGGGQVRLAPLYDLGSALPYFPTQVDPRRARMAMKIGGHYRWREVAGREWAKLATLWKVEEDWVRGRILRMAEALPAAAEATGRELADAGLTHPVAGRLVVALRTVKLDEEELR